MVDAPQAKAVVYARQSSGKAKSIDDQIDECTDDAEEQGWTVASIHQDGVSASRFADKARDAWPRVLADIEARAFDVLILWESSRGDRDAEQWLGLLRRCRDQQVFIRITSHGRTYDLSNAHDFKALASDGIDSHFESEKLSLRTRRGVASAAKKGRPPMGTAPYGYRRVYNKDTGKLEGQEPDPKTAPIVKEIFDRVARSEPLSEIQRDLNERRVPAPRGGQWRRLRIRELVTNPAFIGRRKHGGETYPADWAPLVDEATFYAADRVLNEPARMKTARPGRQVHLLSYLARCSTCGKYITARSTYYRCPQGHLNIRHAAADDFIRDMVLGRLAVPGIHAKLRQAGEDADREVVAARGQAAKLRAELDSWRLSAARNQTSPESLAVIEADLVARIREADRHADRAAIPPALRQFVGPDVDVRARWDAAPLPARRSLIEFLAEIIVRPAGQNAFIPIHERFRDSRWAGDRATWGELADRVAAGGNSQAVEGESAC